MDAPEAYVDRYDSRWSFDEVFVASITEFNYELTIRPSLESVNLSPKPKLLFDWNKASLF